MQEAGYTAYRYRWVLLAAYAGTQAGMQLLCGMDWLRGDGGAMTPTLVILIGLALLNVALVASLPESRIAAGRGRPEHAGLD